MRVITERRVQVRVPSKSNLIGFRKKSTCQNFDTYFIEDLQNMMTCLINLNVFWRKRADVLYNVVFVLLINVLL